MIESWAANVFGNISKISGNKFNLINIEVGANRTDLADVVLQFKRTNAEQLNPLYTTGSGTTVRVAQQLDCQAIGIDIEPSFIEESKQRLSEPLYGFDSIDDRMLRVPNDLNDEDIRREYFKNHIDWFLKNHKSSLINYVTEFKEKYGSKMSKEEQLDFDTILKNNNITLKKGRSKVKTDPEFKLDEIINLF